MSLSNLIFGLVGTIGVGIAAVSNWEALQKAYSKLRLWLYLRREGDAVVEVKYGQHGSYLRPAGLTTGDGQCINGLIGPASFVRRIRGTTYRTFKTQDSELGNGGECFLARCGVCLVCYPVYKDLNGDWALAQNYRQVVNDWND